MYIYKYEYKYSQKKKIGNYLECFCSILNDAFRIIFEHLILL